MITLLDGEVRQLLTLLPRAAHAQYGHLLVGRRLGFGQLVDRLVAALRRQYAPAQFKMMRNPEVSVRSRGVMEKCTYCVQRITAGRITAEKENRKVRDGEVITACQQACPAGAIVFGDLNDPNSRVSKLKAQQRNYNLLEDLNTRPRTSYMAVVQNPNPDLEQSEPS